MGVVVNPLGGQHVIAGQGSEPARVTSSIGFIHYYSLGSTIEAGVSVRGCWPLSRFLLSLGFLPSAVV